MAYKILDLKPQGYLNSTLVNTSDTITILNFVIGNMMTLEKTILTTVYQVMQKIDTVLDDVDGPWVKYFYNHRVLFPVEGGYQYDYKSAILLKIILEILLVQKYIYTTKNEQGLGIPDLPHNRTHIQDDQIPKYYKVDYPARLAQFERTAKLCD